MAESTVAPDSAIPEAPTASPSPAIPLAVRIYRRIVASVLTATLTFTFISSTIAVVLIFRATMALPFIVIFAEGWEYYQMGTLLPIALDSIGESAVAFLRTSATGAALIGMVVGFVVSMLLGMVALFESSRWRKRVRDRIAREKAKHLGQNPDKRPALRLFWNIFIPTAQLSLGVFALQWWYGVGCADSIGARPLRSVVCSVAGLSLSDALLDRWVWSKYRALQPEQRQASQPEATREETARLELPISPSEVKV